MRLLQHAVKLYKLHVPADPPPVLPELSSVDAVDVTVARRKFEVDMEAYVKDETYMLLVSSTHNIHKRA